MRSSFFLSPASTMASVPKSITASTPKGRCANTTRTKGDIGNRPPRRRACHGGITQNPPMGYHAIHIIVNNGHVTLFGACSQPERCFDRLYPGKWALPASSASTTTSLCKARSQTKRRDKLGGLNSHGGRNTVRVTGRSLCCLLQNQKMPKAATTDRSVRGSYTDSSDPAKLSRDGLADVVSELASPCLLLIDILPS